MRCHKFAPMDSIMKVSVVIPVYKAEAFIREAVESALALNEVAEVILVEDGSPDGSLQVCRILESEQGRVRLLRHADGRNMGASASRNLGIRSAGAPLVAFLDADDRYLPERFRSERAVWQAHPDCDGVYGAVGVYFHDAIGRDRFDARFKESLTTIRATLRPEELFPAFVGVSGHLGLGHIHLDGLTLRKASIERLPYLMREDVDMGEDTEFITRISAGLRLYPGCTTNAVALRGVHQGNRITQDRLPLKSRRILYKALLDWAESDPQGMVGRRRIGEAHAGYALKSAKGLHEGWSAIRSLMRYPGTLRRADHAEALVHMLCGRIETISWTPRWIVRALYRTAWRFRGGVPPEVRASVAGGGGGAA